MSAPPTDTSEGFPRESPFISGLKGVLTPVFLLPIVLMFSIEKWSVYKRSSSDFRVPMFFLPIVVKLGVSKKI